MQPVRPVCPALQPHAGLWPRPPGARAQQGWAGARVVAHEPRGTALHGGPLPIIAARSAALTPSARTERPVCRGGGGGAGGAGPRALNAPVCAQGSWQPCPPPHREAGIRGDQPASCSESAPETRAAPAPAQPPPPPPPTSTPQEPSEEPVFIFSKEKEQRRFGWKWGGGGVLWPLPVASHDPVDSGGEPSSSSPRHPLGQGRPARSCSRSP